MNSSTIRNTMALHLVLILTGACMDAKSEITESSNLRNEVADMLGNAIVEVSKSKRMLTAAENKNSVAVTNPSLFDVTTLPAELRELTNFEWSGSAVDAVGEIAERIGYSFFKYGNAPSISPMVHIHLELVPVADVLEKIGLQSYPVGEIVVNPNEKRIEFHYIQSLTNPGDLKNENSE